MGLEWSQYNLYSKRGCKLDGNVMMVTRLYAYVSNSFTIIMRSTKVQTLGRIWWKYWNISIENTLHAYVLGEHTSMKNEL